jgi:outer membrane protein TolC
MDCLSKSCARFVAILAAMLLWEGTICAAAPDDGKKRPANDPPVATGDRAGDSLLGRETRPIDLDSALRLAGVRNPELLLARERVTEAMALRQFAAAQLLPNINAGFSYDDHTGNLQGSNGVILSEHRQALYAGAGAGAVGAGTVAIPGVVWSGQISEVIYNGLISGQVVAQQAFAAEAARNDVLLRVADTYEELLRAEGARAVATRIRDDAKEVARLTAAYAQTGQGKKADADRAATEYSRRQFDVVQAEGHILTASARLSQLLNLDPAIRLQPIDRAVVPAAIVCDSKSLKELIAVALVRRPELKERRAVIRQALLALDNARALPFTPTVAVGFSAGTFGGGSNLAPPELGDFAGRTDFDAVAYWTLRNLGVGNRALVHQAESRLRGENYRLIQVLDQVGDEVAEAFARTRARFVQIAISEEAVGTAQHAFTEDLTRIRGREGLPIEVINSLRLLALAHDDYLNAIIDYNRAEFELYVALGQPPSGEIARSDPAGQAPTASSPSNPPEQVPTPSPGLRDK